jgi:hypothetical protein
MLAPDVMTDTDMQPPRPRLTLRVGVTGHRWGASLDPGETTRIKAQLGGILLHSAAVAEAVCTRHRASFAPAPPRLVAVSSLAEGADRLFASEALAAGWELEAVLPFAAEEYAHDFESAERKREFEALLARSGAVFEIADPRRSGDASEAYETAGLVMLEQIDLLIAIWDGGESRGRGGTREVADEATRRGVPVVWVHAGAANPAALWDGFAALPLPELEQDVAATPAPFAQVVSDLVAPPAEGPAAERLRNFFAEAERAAPWWTRGYDIMLRVAVGRPLRLFAPPVTVASRHGEWDGFLQSLPPNGTLSERLRTVLLARFLWADQLATLYGRVYRGAYVLVFTLAALAVAVGLLALFFWDFIWAKTVFVIVEFVLIALIIAITRAGSRGSWHQRFLDARRLAEMLRHARMLAPLGRTAGVGEAPHTDPGEHWTSWYARAARRELGLPRARADAGYLERVMAATFAHEVAPQIAYHRNNQRMLRSLHHRLDHLGVRFFYVTGALCVVWLVAAALYESGLAGAEWIKSVLKPLLTFLAAVLPAMGAALAGIRAQGDFETSAARSQATERELVQIGERVAQSPPTDYRQACIVQLAVADAMASELGSWRSLYANRPLAIPG